MQTARFLSWSRTSFIIGVVLATIFLIPSVWFPLQLGKVGLFLIFLLVAAVLLGVHGGMRSILREGGLRGALLVAALPVMYLVSWYFSLDKAIGFTGFSVESDTVLFVVICFLAFFTSFALFRSFSALRNLLFATAAAICAAVLFQYVVIVTGVPFSVFSDHSVNLIGKWNDLGFLAGLVFLLSLMCLEFVQMTLVRRMVLGAVAVGLFVLLAMVEISLVSWLILGFSLLIAALSFISRRPSGEHTAEVQPPAPRFNARMVPWVPLAGALASALLLLWGSAVNSSVTKVFPVSSLEVRPSLSSTLDIVRASHGNSFTRFLIGTGPQTFGDQWLRNKPVAVNQTAFWNLDFNVGFSTFVTALGTVGVLGALAWLIPLALVLLGLMYALRSPTFSAQEKLLMLCASASSAYLWFGVLFYVPSEDVLLLAFALCGATFGLSAKKRLEAAQEHASPASAYPLVPTAVAVVLVAVVLASAFVVGRRFIAEAYTNQGLYAASQGSADKALALASKAQGIEKTNDDLRLSADAGLLKLQQLASVQNPSQDVQNQFTQEAQKIIPLAQGAIAMAPQDYRGYVSLAKLYDLLMSLGVQGAFENAQGAYLKAAELNPTDPQIPLLLARVEYLHGNAQNLQVALSRALTLKPDYTDAILFVVQLDVANKDLPSAVKAAQAAVKSAPGVPSIWFELGLLYYSSNDTADAIPVLEQAVKLQPDYANAKYFLGLSYAAQNRTQDAIAQFEDLQKTNPDNQEVKLILSNLEAGKPPFAGAQPPATQAPQSRETAPISQ